MSIFNDKRGISPLAATSILVIISILLGTIVMSIMESQLPEIDFSTTGEQEIKRGCNLVDAQIATFQDQELICLRNNYLDMIIDNSGNININDFQASLIGEREVQNFDSLDFALKKGNSGRIKIPYDQKIGTILKIKIIPKIEYNQIICLQKAIEKENIKNC